MSNPNECPTCGNASKNLVRQSDGARKCSVCTAEWNPTAAKPAPVASPVSEALAEAVALPRGPRENAAKQIRQLHAHLKTYLPTADDGVLRELALDFHQVLADAVAMRRVQAGIDALTPQAAPAPEVEPDEED